MNIDGVSTGIVLDHIKAGKSMQIYELLRLDKIDNCVAIIQNADSSKYGKRTSSRSTSSSIWTWMYWATSTATSPSTS